jgi:transposase
LPYVGKRKEAAEKFKVTTKTILRWLREYDLAGEEHAFCSHKLDMDKAVEIRLLHKQGKSMKDLAALYGVTFSTVSRIIHNIAYHQDKDVADVKVIYNPDPKLSSLVAVFEWKPLENTE